MRYLTISAIKGYIKTNKRILSLLSFIYRIFSFNKIRIKGKNNLIDSNCCGLFLSKSSIKILGDRNVLKFQSDGLTYIRGLNIVVTGHDNVINIGNNVSCTGLSICIEDDNNQVILGDDFKCGANTHLAAIEGTSIVFGNDCLLSANISVRTGDSHSILDLDGNRINTSKSVLIGEHTWIGNSVLIFKGANVGHHSIIAGGSVVTGKTTPPHTIIGGNPAKVLKENINWKLERI